MQDAWVRLAGQEHGTIAGIRAFLHRVVDNLAIDQGRRRQLHARYQAPEIAPEAVAEVAATIPTVEERMIDADRQRSYEGILAGLPERCREALILSRIEGWPHNKIARHLGVSPNTVTAYIRRALALSSMRHGTPMADIGDEQHASRACREALDWLLRGPRYAEMPISAPGSTST